MKSFAKWVLILWSGFCLFGVFYGLAMVGKTIEQGSDAAKAGSTIGAGCGMGLWIAIWGAIALPALIIWLVSGQKAKVTPEGERTSPSNPKLCSSCGKYFDGTPNFCPSCGKPV